MPYTFTTIALIYENKILGSIFVVLFFAFIVWEAWPSMKANNIFMDRITKYGKPGRTKMYGVFSPIQTFAFCFALNILEIALWIYRAMQPAVPPSPYHHHDNTYAPGMLFFLSTFGMFALFIYSFVEDVEFGPIRNFKYALKAWAVGMFLPPMVLMFINCDKIIDNALGPYLYLKTLILANGFGCFSFAVLIWITHYVSKKTWHSRKKRSFIFILVQVAIVLNIIMASRLIHPDVSWFLGWFIYAVTIGLCTCYFDMDTTVYSDETYYIAEVID